MVSLLLDLTPDGVCLLKAKSAGARVPCGYFSQPKAPRCRQCRDQPGAFARFDVSDIGAGADDA
jgi:hypothetical protein